MKRRLMSLLPALFIPVCVAVACVALADDPPAGQPDEAPPQPPPPLTLTLKVEPVEFTLDLRGMTEAEFIAAVQGPEEGRPPVPKAKLSLKLINTSDKRLTIWYGAMACDPFRLHLDGPGAISAVDPPLAAAAMKSRSLDPGQSFGIELDSLAARPGIAWWWTQPGEYRLTAQAQVFVMDGKNNDFGFLAVSKPVILTVVEKAE